MRNYQKFSIESCIPLPAAGYETGRGTPLGRVMVDHGPLIQNLRKIVKLVLNFGLRRWFILYKLHDFTNGAMENPTKDLYCVGANAFVPF